MAHVQFAVYADPPKHKEIIKRINDFAYEHEGPLAKGLVRPYISEIRYYDVRIPEEYVAQFCKDFNMRNAENFKELTKSTMKYHGKIPMMAIPNILTYILQLFSPFKNVKFRHLERKHKITRPYYAWMIGKIDDPIQTDVLGNKREVL